MISTLPFAFIKAGEKQTKIKTKQKTWTPDVSMIGTARLDQFENLLLRQLHVHTCPPPLPPLGKKLKESLFVAPLPAICISFPVFRQSSAPVYYCDLTQTEGKKKKKTGKALEFSPFPFFTTLPLLVLSV